ncbi:MAG TPA: hypothetical protein VK550_32675, partial [Polyangiaceae bacterium]|nr:hypothetical protein [Polyangiaceae bacterium]
MTKAPRNGSARRAARCWAAVGALLTGSCLLTTSLDGLEGPPLVPDAGAPDGGSPDATEGGWEDAADADAERDPGGEGGSDAADGDATSGDRIPDAVGDSSDIGDAIARGPIVVAPTSSVVRGLAEHGADVYWVQGDPSAGIVRAPKAGGGPSAFFHMPPNAFDVAVDADYVYWSTGKKDEVFRKPIGSVGPDEELVYSGANETLYLAVGTVGRIYATGFNTVVVGPRADASTSFVHYPAQMGAAGIAFNGAGLYWSVTAGVVRGDESGQSPPRSVYSGAPGEVSGIAADEQDLYWISA